VRAAARAFTGRLGSAHWQLEAAASFWHATAATGSGSPGARDFGREASPLVYAAPNLTLIDYYRNLTMMEVLLVDRAGISGKEDPEDSLLASMWRGACESTPASRNAPMTAVCNQG
jgi:hypothetical protein